MIQRLTLCAVLLALLGACGESGDAEERYFDHYQESIERAEEVQDRLKEAEDRRRQMIEEQDS